MKNREFILPALKTALIFLVVGFVWVLVSDELLHQLSPNHKIESQIQTYKDWFFIALTSILIYFIFSQQLKRIINYKNRLQISERSLSVILENIGEGIISTDKTGVVTAMNKVAENITGVTKKQAKGQPIFDVIRITDHNESDITGVLFNKPTNLMDMHESSILKTIDGSKSVKVFVNTDRIYDNGGHHQGNIIAFRDISGIYKRDKALKESEERFRTIIETAVDGFMIIDFNGFIIGTNDSYSRMTGYSKVELLSMKLADLEAFESLFKISDQVKKIFEEGNANFETKHQTKNGDILDIEVSAKFIKAYQSIFIFLKDITERKQAEEEIKIFKNVLDSSTDAIGMATPEGNHVYQNRTFDEMFGDIGDKRPETVFVNQNIGREVFKTIMRGDEWKSEVAMHGKDNKMFDILLRAYPVKNNGKIIALVGVHTDISERKQAEEALREREDRLSKIMIVATDGMWDWNLATNKVYFDPRYYQMAGYKADEFEHRLEEFEKRIHPDDKNFVMGQAEKYIKGEIDRFEVEFRFKKKSGDWLWVLGQGVIVEWGENGMPMRFVGTHTDITDRKLAEEELQLRVEFEQRVSKISAELVGVSGSNINQVINQALASIGEFIDADRAYVFRFKNHGNLMDNTHEWCADGVESQINSLKNILKSTQLPWFAKHIQKRQVFHVPDVAALPPEASLEREHFEAQNIKSLICVPMETSGNLTGFLGFDCVREQRAWTEEEQSLLRFVGQSLSGAQNRTQAEEALLVSEERFRSFMENSTDASSLYDANLCLVEVNRAGLAMFPKGTKREDVVGQNLQEMDSNLKGSERFQSYLDVLKTGEPLKIDEYIPHPLWGDLYLSVRAFKVGNGLGMIVTDITKQKLAEKAIEKSRNRLELALDGGGLGLWDYHIKSEKMIVSKHWTQMLGIDNDSTITADTFSALVHPEDLHSVNEAFLACFKMKDVEFKMEFRMKHSDGSWKWVLSKGMIMEWDVEGNPTRIVGTNMDVTETKQLELQLKRSVNIYQSFIKYASEGIYLFELEKPMPLNLGIDEQIEYFYKYGYVETCNDAFAKMYGYNRAEELVGKKQAQLHGGDDVPENIEFLQNYIKSDYRIMEAISKEIDKEGNEIYISNNVVGIIEGEKLVRTWGSQFDITDRIRAQQELEESEKKYRLLFQTNPVPLVIVGADEFNFLDVNDASEKLLGYSRDEFYKMKLWDIRPEMLLFTRKEMKAQLPKSAGIPHEAKLVTKQGEIVLAEINFDIINYEGQQATLAAINEITALKEAEKRVLKSIIEGEDNERKRVSKELHDGLGQHLTAASLNFDSVKGSVLKLGEKDNQKFITGLEFLKTAIEESRNIAHNLMPKAIDDFGLIPSLTSLLNQIEKLTGINVKFYENLGEGRLNKQIELNLYRITQEAINNVIKHSKATEVFVQLVLHKREIIFTFEDNGIGFDASRDEITSKGMGLKSIFNRVKAMAGNFELDVAPKKGTAITIEIPI